MYADETGNLDYGGAGKRGSSAYFGFGTVVFRDDHGKYMQDGMRLRAQLETAGVKLPNGFHAVDDSIKTKEEMYRLIKEQAPRVDTTFLCKENAYPRVRERGETYLYQMAWYMHFKEIATQVSDRSDVLYVIAGTIGTKARDVEAREALRRVCAQVDRNIILCVWNAATAWGIQVADYALWATQRHVENRKCTWFEPCIRPNLSSLYLPWGVAKS